VAARLPEFEVGETAGCIYCSGTAEPEQDGDVLYFTCTACGNSFGHRRARQQAPSCAAGLALPEPVPASQVFIGSISRRPE
jgi:hypothetical protein